MPESERPTRTFLLDTNVFVAAVKDPRRETATPRLLIGLLGREEVELVGDEYWAEELLRYTEEFRSETATWLAGALLGRARLVRIAPKCVKLCAQYMATPDPADFAHAATSSRRMPSRLQTTGISTGFATRASSRYGASRFCPNRG